MFSKEIELKLSSDYLNEGYMCKGFQILFEKG